MIIRKATKEDIPALFDLARRVHLGYPYTELIPQSHWQEYSAAYEDTDYNRDKYYQKLNRYIDQPQSWAYVAEVDGQIAGYRVFYHDGTMLHLRGLFVDEAYRRRGIGSALFRQALYHAPDDVPMELTVLEGNENAIRLYERDGFRRRVVPPTQFHGASQISMIRDGAKG